MNRFDCSRPDQVTGVAGSATVFASMRYLGLGTLVGLNYDGASNLNLTYQNGGTGTAGDKYTGLDRFGRIVGTIWIKGSGEVVQGVYGRNRSSGIDWRRDDEASSIIAMDALYEYDGLQQVTAWKRGNLVPGSGPPYTGINNQKQGEDYTYDQTGNWLGDVSDNPNFTQSRTHNVNNQITSITGPTGVIQPAYDNAGNMTLAPSPASWTTGYAYKWDAWNRLVEIKQGSTVIGSYAYDALTRRTRKTVGGVTRDIYYDRQWRSVEEREGATVKVQHAWSPLDRWTLIRRKRNASGGTLNETLFCLRDYLDPVAVADTSGAVVERYNYDTFGTVRIMSAAFGVRGSSSYDWDFLYHGEFRDEESELYNYGYRYLDTQLGRWLSRDPIGERGGVNLYAFVGNAPQTAYDRLGLLKLTYNSDEIELGECGNFKWKIKWVVLPASGSDEGLILQEINIDEVNERKSLEPIKYWEAWPVFSVDKSAVISYGGVDIWHNGIFLDESLSGPYKDGIKGEQTTRGWARYRTGLKIVDIVEAMPFGTVSMAGTLPSSEVNPKFETPKSALVYRRITVKWCCRPGATPEQRKTKIKNIFPHATPVAR